MNTPGEITLTREFDAPRSRVFQAWTDPQQLAQWWGPHGFSNPRCEWDPRPGGKIHVDMRGPDGTVYPMPGTFREIVEPERLVFACGAADAAGTMMFEILNIVTFEEIGRDKTRLTLRTELIHSTEEAKQRYLSGQKIGWSQSLVRFREFLKPAEEQAGAPNEIILSRVFDAPRETVWEAMTDPEQVAQWWGPHGFSTTIEEMDVRPGGKWNHVMHGPDGANYPNYSVFTEVVKPERLSYTHGGHKEGGGLEVAFQMTWTLDALEDGRTRLTLRQVHPTAERRDQIAKFYGAIEGGKQTLGRLAEHIATTPLVIERTFAAPAEKVWKAISDKDEMKEWYFDLPGFRAEVGCEFDFAVEHNGTRYVHLCRVTEVIAGQKLAYTWRYEGLEGDSLVTWELSPEGDGTRVRLTHEGLETFPPVEAYARHNFVRGWTSILDTGLAPYLAR